LKGEVIEMNNHKMVILNTTYAQTDTPESILDWLNLIRESMKNPESPNINRSKPAIVKAAQLAEVEYLNPQELADAKIQEMKKKAVAVIEDNTRKETKDDGIRKQLIRGKLTIEEIAEDFEVSIQYVNTLK
jgi:hypothetical protein